MSSKNPYGYSPSNAGSYPGKYQDVARAEKAAAKAAAKPLISKERLDKGVAIAVLERQAAEWQSKADDRTSGLDHEVKALYRDKAAKATAEAARLTRELRGEPEPVAKAVGLNRAAQLESEAGRHQTKADDQTLPLDVRQYYRMRAREARDAAAAARGEELVYDSSGQHR